MSRKVYKIVQDRFVKAIQNVIDGKEELLPWQKPWKGSKPINYISRRPYSGINLLLLDGGEYLTYNQYNKLKKKNPELNIKKNSKRHLIVYWKMYEKEDKDGNINTIPFLRYYKVFHQSSIENLKSKIENKKNHPLIDEAEDIINDYIKREGVNKKTILGSSRAYYRPSDDLIVMPNKDQFDNIHEYYSTLFHEASHSTGHKDRLNRFSKGSFNFGSNVYSKEELIAEISSQMLLGTLNIKNRATEKNSISYLHGWMKAIKEDVNLIISAAKYGEAAADYILGGNKMCGNPFEIWDEVEGDFKVEKIVTQIYSVPYVSKDELQWHTVDMGIEVLTLDEIFEQISKKILIPRRPFIRVSYITGLWGVIFETSNYSNNCSWIVFGVTKGYA